MTRYSEVLDRVHQHLLPRTYLEVGVFRGRTLELALPCTRAIGLDPDPQLLAALGDHVRLELTTSDDFFDSGRADRLIEPGDVDVAFIDGMHLFEFALRDFLNIERYAHREAVVFAHDCLPRDAGEAGREPPGKGLAWTGDVWKTLYCLLELRPDLDITVITAPPTGLAMIRDLDPTSTLIDPHDQGLIERVLALEFDALASDVVPRVRVVEPVWERIEPLLPPRYQPRDDLPELLAARGSITPDIATRVRRATHAARTAPVTRRLARWGRAAAGAGPRS